MVQNNNNNKQTNNRKVFTSDWMMGTYGLKNMEIIPVELQSEL